MPLTELVDIPASRKILHIGDSVDDQELKEHGEIWSDQLESDLSEFNQDFPLTGENQQKAIRCITLGIASGYKNAKGSKDQAEYYLKLYKSSLAALITRLRTTPSSARVVSRNEYVTRPLFFQRRRL